MRSTTYSLAFWARFLLIGFGVVLGVFVFTACRTQRSTVTSSQATSSEQRNITEQRPYTADSVWNTPIGPDPIYDPFSEEMVATIGLHGDGRITSDPTQFTYPVYFVDESTSRWNVPCLVYTCTIVMPTIIVKTALLEEVPIPAEAQPSQGHDAQMIIIDRTTLTEYDLWQVERTDTGWTVSNASVYNVSWDGMPEKYGSRGAGVPYYAGLIRPWEIEFGRIEHAIAFGYPEPAADRCVFPATKTDGQSTLPFAIPEGARLQLDPTLTEADLDDMGLDRTGKIIARALQEYGMILIDYAGRPKVYPENLSDNPYAEASWSDRERVLTDETIAAIPYTYFNVLALPDMYWNSPLEAVTYGDCFDYMIPQ